MDLPFLNNAPAGAPATSPGAPQGGDFWGGDAGGGNDDATLNDLLALYQTANEPAPSFTETTALAEPAFAPAPAFEPAFVQAPVADPFAMPGADAEIDELIKSFQTAPTEPVFSAPPLEPMFAPEPVFAAPPAEPMFAPEPVFATPPAEPMFAPEPVFATPPAEPVFAPEPVFAAPPAEPVVAPEPVFAAPPAQPVPTPPAAVVQAPVPMPQPTPAVESMRMATIPQAAPVEVPAGALRLATSEERQAAMQGVVSAVNQLTTGIEHIQSQLATLYEGLAHAAAHRAPVTEIVTLTEQLTATKSQAGENSPMWQQALMLRQTADAYLQMLKTL